MGLGFDHTSKDVSPIEEGFDKAFWANDEPTDNAPYVEQIAVLDSEGLNPQRAKEAAKRHNKVM